MAPFFHSAIETQEFVPIYSVLTHYLQTESNYDIRA